MEPETSFTMFTRAPALVPILSQMNPVHTFQPYHPKIHFILSSHLRLGLPSASLPSAFPIKILYALLNSPSHDSHTK